jgi:hypothetical protein
VTSAYVLTELRLPRPEVRELFKGVRAVQEEVAAYDEAVLGKVHRILLRMGRKRFGEPPPEIEQELLQIWDEERLDQMSDRILEVNSWQELLATR